MPGKSLVGEHRPARGGRRQPRQQRDGPGTVLHTGRSNHHRHQQAEMPVRMKRLRPLIFLVSSWLQGSGPAVLAALEPCDRC